MSVPADAGGVLLPLAREAITARLEGRAERPFVDEPAWLAAPGAAFVTLTASGRLRGCIGSLQAHRPLGEDVRENALAAALRDPRFQPLRRDELAGVRIEVSVLSPPEPVEARSTTEALAALRPHVDGAILSDGRRRGTFLPQVWEQLSDPAEFLAHLQRKAGLPIGKWTSSTRLERYTVSAWEEET